MLISLCYGITICLTFTYIFSLEMMNHNMHCSWIRNHYIMITNTPFEAYMYKLLLIALNLTRIFVIMQWTAFTLSCSSAFCHFWSVKKVFFSGNAYLTSFTLVIYVELSLFLSSWISHLIERQSEIKQKSPAKFMVFVLSEKICILPAIINCSYKKFGRSIICFPYF